MSKLFTPIQLGGITLPNRVVIAPMCQYSASDGTMGDWHMIHLGQLACSGAGMLVIEATGVTREGRISHGCTGIYSDDNEAAIKRVVDACRRIDAKMPIGIQLAHAGRKGSSQRPWEGGAACREDESPWRTLSSSALPFGDGWHTPHEMSEADIKHLVEAFARAAARVRRIGLDAIEMHSAHGYLMHQFLSPLSNTRKDRYGGSLENRMRAPLEVAEALRASWPKERCLGARITASDWLDGGFEVADAVIYARKLKEIGFDYACVTSGGVVPHARVKVGPGYQVPFAEQVRKGSGIATRAVGMIADPEQAEEILASGKADMVTLARGFLDNPRWVWHAAEKFGAKVDYPPQYARSHSSLWPGAKIARPQETAPA